MLLALIKQFPKRVARGNDLEMAASFPLLENQKNDCLAKAKPFNQRI
jgi:hypothetical protein